MGDSRIDATDEMSCNELVDLVTDYLEDTLALPDRARFDAHLAECPGCTEYVEQMRLTLELTGKLEDDAVTDEVRGTLLAAFRGWRREADT